MADTSSFREVVRSVTVSYPIPFLVAVLFGFSLSVLLLAAITTAPMQWLTAGLGSFAALTASGLACYAVFRKPELLRHERVELIHRALDILGNDELSEEARRALAETFVELLTQGEVRKHGLAGRNHTGEMERDG